MPEGSYPMSKVRGRSQEDPMPKGSYPTSELRGRSREDPMPQVRGPRGATPFQGQGQRPRVPGCNSAGMAERSYPTSEVRGSVREELAHIQGAVAAQAQEGLEELFHIQGQEGRR